MSSLRTLLDNGLDDLAGSDPELAGALEREHARQARTLSLVASASLTDPSVLACQAATAVNVTAEGYPGRRFHGGCTQIDVVERLAIERARRVFGAAYANVQPHSATTANYAVLSALMRPGDTLLGMALDSGGHLTHGSAAAYAGQYFHAVGYGVGPSGLLDYAEVARLAERHRPRVIIAGGTAYPRSIDFARFRAIADAAGAYLVADVSHTAGLIVAGLAPNPVDHAHVTTTCTHKQLAGPRGGLILAGRDHAAPDGRGTLADLLQRAVFPFFQGAPAPNVIAAKARAFALADTPEFHATAHRIRDDARAIAERLADAGLTPVSGGTDNHIVLVDLRPYGLTGSAAQSALESCGLVVNKNRVPGDASPAHVTGGIRIGTNGIAQRGMGPAEAAECADLIHRVLVTLGRDGAVDPAVRAGVREDVARLCAAFPYPAGRAAGRSGHHAAQAQH